VAYDVEKFEKAAEGVEGGILLLFTQRDIF